jgi:hypothetical protein
VGRYTSIANPAYNLLIKPTVNDSLEKAAEMASMFYSNMTASEVCKLIPKGQ